MHSGYACRRRGEHPVQDVHPPPPRGRGGYERGTKPLLPAVHQIPPSERVRWSEARLQKTSGSSQLEAKAEECKQKKLAQNVAASAAHCTTELTTDLIAPSGQTPGAPPTAAVQQPMLPSDTSSYLGDLRETSGATKPSGSGQQSSHDMRKLPRESPICTQDVSVGFNPSDPIPTSTPWLGGPVREEPLSWTQPTPQLPQPEKDVGYCLPWPSASLEGPHLPKPQGSGMPTNNHHQCFQHDNSKFQDMAVVPCGNVLKGSANTSGGLGQEQRPPLSTGGLPGSSKIFEALELEMYHIDMKIAGITPAELPPDLACQLMSYHEALPWGVEGTIRPGCLHLSLDFTMGSAEDRRTAETSFLLNFWNDVASGEAAQRNLPWGIFDTTVLLPNGAIQILNQGQSISVVPRPDGPIIHRIFPMAVSGATACMVVSNLEMNGFRVLCRVGGRQHELQVSGQECMAQGHLMIEFSLPPLANGFAWIEVMQDTAAGMFLSKPRAMLITNWEDVAGEISSLSHGYHPLRQGHVDCLLRDLGAAFHAIEAPPNSVYASCMARAVRLGLHDTFEALGDEVLMRGLSLSEVLSIANELPDSNLASLAVQSGSLATLQKVSVLSAEAGVEVQADRVDQESGMAAVHWAAAAEMPHMLSELIRCSPGAARAWRSLPGGQYGLTPCEMFGPEAAVFEQQHVPEQASTADSQYAESAIEYRTLEESTSREAPGWSTQAVLIAAFVAVLLSTAAVMGSAPRKCGSLFLVVQGSLLLTVWFCWRKYAITLNKMRHLARSAGFELTWFLAPTDPGVEAAYCSFVTLKMSTWHDSLSFGGMFAVPLLMAMGFYHLNHGLLMSPGSFFLGAAVSAVAVLARRALIQRSALRGLEWFNMTADLCIYLLWVGTAWVVLQQGPVPGAKYMGCFVALPPGVMLVHLLTVAVVQSTSFFPSIRFMVPFRLLGILLFMTQVYLSFKINPISHSVKTELACGFLACILSSGAYVHLRIKKEQTNLSAFISQIGSKTTKLE
eukprot:CAMPEP_0117692678 /NCGR_PEP_ID=MMETSP0804-20121206/26456_1 /TAXON_ID=1074897 /ORGANISM="Tetraselmis astigmatica, Strain CCMP880" /LENGTH=1011 /DNA_ID=CAMNT_0005506143 /DNA_START=169 /DNA_END=3205 /DNA_ORIENTATION=-